MLNGDRYVGRVVSLGADTLVIQSEVLGTLKLPRAKISTITLSSAADKITNSVRIAPAMVRSNNLAKTSMALRTNASPDFAATMKELGGSSNMVQQIQQQLLGGAGPEAQAKFNDLLGGLLSGKLNLDDLRAEAKSTLAQARSARKELGEENSSMLDSYMAILDSFLRETEQDAAPTNGVPKNGASVTKPLEKQ
jgi:hypothetical protein